MLKFLIKCLFFSLFRKDAELLLQERIKAEQEHIRKHEEMMTLVSQKNRELEKYAGMNMNIQIKIMPMIMIMIWYYYDCDSDDDMIMIWLDLGYDEYVMIMMNYDEDDMSYDELW